MVSTGTGGGIGRITMGRTPLHMGTVYGREREIARQQVEEHTMLPESFSRPVFAVGASSYKHASEGFVDPGFGPGSMVQWDSLKRLDEDRTFLAGPFSKCVPTKTRLPMRSNSKKWCRQLYALLAEDWPDLHYTLRITKEELLVQFPVDQPLPAAGALQRYMAHLAAHGMAAGIGLQKRGDRWCVLETNEEGDDRSNPRPVPDDVRPAAAGLLAISEDAAFHDDDASEATSEPAARNDVKLLTFSFYFPWVTAGRLVVHRKASRRERQATVANRNQQSSEDRLLDTMVSMSLASEQAERQKHAREKGKRGTTVIVVAADLLSLR